MKYSILQKNAGEIKGTLYKNINGQIAIIETLIGLIPPPSK